MRNTDDRAFHHALDRVDLVLHFLRIDVVAARDHEILAAADDVHIAARIDPAEIARDEEPVRSELGLGLFPANSRGRHWGPGPRSCRSRRWAAACRFQD